MNRHKRTTILIGLLLCMGASTVMQTYFSSALPAISDSFKSVSFYSWIHGSYILASSAVILLSSSLCQRYGNKKNFIIGSLLFGAGTIIAPFSSSMLQLVIARIVMGIGAGIVVPATYGIIGEHYEKENYSAVFAAFAVVQIVFNGLGSLAGGYLPHIASWQAIFYFLLPVELLSFLLVYRNLPAHVPVMQLEPFLFRQHLLMIIAILLVTLGIEQAYHQQYLLLVFGVVLLFLVVWWDIRKENILLPTEFVSDPLLRNLCFQVFLLGAFYHACLAYLPSIMQFSMGYGADTAGNLMALFVVLMGIGSIVGGLLKISERSAILIGWLISLAGCIFMALFFTLAMGLLGFGSGMLMSVLLGYTAARTRGHAAGVNSTAHLIRNIGGSIGTILFQFSLSYPQKYYTGGVFFLALSGVIVMLAAFRFKNILANRRSELRTGGGFTMKYIKKFQEVKKGDISIVGGKGANLGEMFNAGFPIPDGFCITGATFDEFMKRNKCEQLSADNEKLRSEIAAGQIWAELEKEIIECYADLGHNMRVAVRSSATAEDLPEASFAGQQETYLNVIGKEQLIIAIKKCFASLYSTRAVTYRKQVNFDTIKVSLAVVIQKMVESEVSGVLFTADPVSQETEQMMLNASWGLGEAIVSGKVTPDIYIYSKKHRRIIEKKLSEKEILICYGTTGIEERKTTLEQKNSFCLSEKQALEIFEMGQKVEQHYGSPQDIEWAISEGKLYLLQSRPITTLNKTKERPPELSASQKAVLNNWIEHCPTPLYPLDVEPCKIIDKAKSKVFHELGVSIGGELNMDEKGILSFSTGTMHISPRIIKIPLLLRKFTDYAINSLNTEQGFSRIKKVLNEKFTEDISMLSVSALVQQVKELMNLSEEIAYIRFRYNIFPSVAVAKLLNLALHRVDKHINEFDLLSDLPYKTWELNVTLRNLAAYIQEHSELKEAILDLKIEDDNAIVALCNNYSEFSIKLQNLLNEFGWKSSSSYCAFGSVSWFEDLTPLFTIIKALLQAENIHVENNKYQAILAKISNRFSAKKAIKLHKQIEEIRGYHMNREESLYLIEMCYGLARRMVFELSGRFPETFEQRKDILFLSLEEVYTLPFGIQEYKSRVMIRKENRIQNERLWNSLSIGGKQENPNILTGVSGNQGLCRGRVRKILTLQEFEIMQPGDILVCRYTDPSWTPLFALAAAVVSDTGGPLSHSAIVAREYNIPAVLGCGNATEVLLDGQEIIVDGDKGIVRVIS